APGMPGRIYHFLRERRPEGLRLVQEFARDSEAVFLFLFSAFVGLIAGSGAVLFRWLVQVVNTVFFNGFGQLLSPIAPYHVVLIPAAGGVLVAPLVFLVAREARGHGVPEVMRAVAVSGGRIRARVAIAKPVASALTIGSGGSAGAEGPIVQIGASLGSIIGRSFRLPKDKAKLLTAGGAAGGIAAIFNAPLAGIFFALEVILGQYGPRHFASVVLAAVTATIVSRGLLGDAPVFKTPAYQLRSLWEVPQYFVFAFLAGLVSVVLVIVINKVEQLFEDWSAPNLVKPALGGLAVGLIGVFFPMVFGAGYNATEMALHGKVLPLLALGLVAAKILATSITLGSGGSGGVFAPSLFTGAMLGTAFGSLTRALFPAVGIPPGAGALVGMAAVFAGMAQAPVTAILILFEMTGDYKIILALMITCVISTLIARELLGASIYELALKMRGFDITRLRRASDLMEKIRVGEAMVKDVITARADDSVAETFLKIEKTHHRGFPVVGGDRLVGIITRRDLLSVPPGDEKTTLVKDVMTADLTVCYSRENLREALEKLGEANVGRIPVVDEDDPERLVGLVTRKSIIEGYNRKVQTS
ncbi:MAG: chloride channel protein, partial [Terriglobia bacterium]